MTAPSINEGELTFPHGRKQYFITDVEQQDWARYRAENTVGQPFYVCLAGGSNSVMVRDEADNFSGVETLANGETHQFDVLMPTFDEDKVWTPISASS